MRWISCATTCFVLLISLCAPTASAAVTAEQRTKINELGELMRQAGKQYSQGDFEQSAEQVRRAQTQLVELLKTRDGALDRLAQPIYRQVTRAHGLLELEGIELEALPSWDAITRVREPPMPAEQVSFQETVGFATQIAPILIENCNGCHIAGRQASGGLRMDTFTQLLRGGDTGPIMIPGNDTDSLLVQKIKGESGQRMPAGGRPPLTEAEIELIATWIREGAQFDGPAVGTDIEDVTSTAWATKASHNELFEQRKQRAVERWQRVLPNDMPGQVGNEQFLVLGNLPQARLDVVLEQLTRAAETVQQQLRTPADEPLIHGGLVVYALKSRYDYSEFGRMSENRELPKDWLGHWRADIVDAYGVLAADPPLDEDHAQALAVQIVAGGFLGSYRGVPTWFAEGIARNLVFTSYRRGDPRVLAWQQAAPAAALTLKSSKSLLEGKVDEETAGLVGMQLTGGMLDRTHRRRFDKLLELLREGQSFDQALTTTFAPAEVLLKNWLGK